MEIKRQERRQLYKVNWLEEQLQNASHCVTSILWVWRAESG